HYPGDTATGGQRGRCPQDVTVPAVPAQSGHLVNGLGDAVQPAGPPLVLVHRRTGGHEEQISVFHGSNRARGKTGTPHPGQGHHTCCSGDVENVEDPPGRQDDIGVGVGGPPAPNRTGVGARLHPPCGGDRVSGRSGTTDPVTRTRTVLSRGRTAHHRPTHIRIEQCGLHHAVHRVSPFPSAQH